MSPKEGQKNVTIPEWVWERADQYFRDNEKILANQKPPIKSTTGLITHWIQEASQPRMEHFNTYDDHATIRDHAYGLYIDLYPRPEGELWCEYCKSTSCVHVKFALTIPEITRPLEKRGWRPKNE